MSPRPTVGFETKCWQRDWEVLLRTDYLDRMVATCAFDFPVRSLIINNVADPEAVLPFAEEKRRRGVLTEYHVAADYADEALAFFGIPAGSLGKGYPYSIAELVGIYLARTDYLLHFASDVLPAPAPGWIEQSVALMEEEPLVRSATLVWNQAYDEARKEALTETPDFYLGYGFSDQCYLLHTRTFRSRIYGETHPASARYPGYGGELFEKRVDAWMRTHGVLRAVYKHGSYRHPAF